MGYIGRASGFTKVTRASLQVRDHTIIPPDRVNISYHRIKQDGVTIEVVQGTWGDYLRDIDMGIVVKEHAPLNDSEKTDAVTIITDVYPDGIPDPFYLPDPLLPY